MAFKLLTLLAIILFIGMVWLLIHFFVQSAKGTGRIKNGTIVELRTPFVPRDRRQYKRYVVGRIKGPDNLYVLSTKKKGGTKTVVSRSEFNVINFKK